MIRIPSRLLRGARQTVTQLRCLLSARQSATMLFLALLLPALAGFAKTKKTNAHHRNTISLYDVKNTGAYTFQSKSGLISTVDRQNNFGLGYSRELYVLPHNYYLSVGARALTTQSFIDARTDLPGFDQYLSYFQYRIRYRQISVPLLVGRHFDLKYFNKATINVFAGGSVGFSKVSSYDNTSQFAIAYGDTGTTIGITQLGFSDGVDKTTLNATLDAGFQITPFGTPKLSIGCAFNYNLLNSVNYKDGGGFANRTLGKVQYFDFEFSRKFVNVLFSVNYSFGK